jgi:Domain of unknown function (DUF5753)
MRRSFVVSEGAIMALERGEGDPDVAVAQRRHLRDLIDELALCVRILHYGTRLLSAPGPAFTIVTDRAGRETLFVEAFTPNDFMLVRDDRRLIDFARHFAELSEVCFDQARSRARIGDAIRYCEQLVNSSPDAVTPAATDGPRYA